MSTKMLMGVLALTAMSSANARDYINIVGSSTVYPFSTVVAEQFGKTSRFKTPKIESTGSGGGFKLFCAGVGTETPDITNSSRRIKQSEIDTCASNGIKEIVEIKIGYDGIALASAKSATDFNLSKKDIYLALAKDVPDPANPGKLMANPYQTWSDVNKDYPAFKIEVLGPPPTSGTRDAFVELVMEEGCKSVDWLKAMEKTDKDAFKAACFSIREDGRFIEAGENDNLIVQKLETNPNAIGIFGYSYLEQNADKIKRAKVDNVTPTFEHIASGEYPVSRPLYFYVKKAHIGKIPGIEGFLSEFTSAKAWGDEGYLADRGLIPMPKAERQQFADDAKALKVLKSL